MCTTLVARWRPAYERRMHLARLGSALVLVSVTHCAAGDTASVTTPDAGDVDADASAVLTLDATPWFDVSDVPIEAAAPRCGDGVCTQSAESCQTCPLDCNACPTCDMAPTCTGALAAPTSTNPLSACNNTTPDGSDRGNYSCGSDLGVAPANTTCADPKLRLRVRELTIQRGFFDIPRQLYCVITAEDGRHAELLLTRPTEVAGNRHSTHVNFRLGESLFWGQGDLYRSISNITVTYQCFLSSNTEGAMRVLDAIAGRAGMAAAHADGYGWVFGTVSVLGTIIGSSLSAVSDSQILDVQQTISASALLALTNGRSWDIHQRRGNLDLSGASDLRLSVDTWGCADVRVVAP